MSILFVERSTLLRLGARLAFNDVGVRAPVVDRAKPPRWGTTERGAVGGVSIFPEHWLGWSLPIEEVRLRDALGDPDLVGALLDDIGEALALAADMAFLKGGDDAPDGISEHGDVHRIPEADPLESARGMLARVRAANATFRSPGWIVHPKRFEQLAVDELPSGPADSTLLLQGDGADGGVFLGYPYLVSEAAADEKGAPAVFFSADWGEAWIAAEPDLVGVRLSIAGAGPNQMQIRVVARMNLALRRPEFFAVSP